MEKVPGEVARRFRRSSGAGSGGGCGAGSGGGSGAGEFLKQVPVFISGGYNAAGQENKEHKCKLQFYGGGEMDFLHVFYVYTNCCGPCARPPLPTASAPPLIGTMLVADGQSTPPF